MTESDSVTCRVFGLETEYALMSSGYKAQLSPGAIYDALEAFLHARHATAICRTVAQNSSNSRVSGLIELKEGFFLDTGARVYYDAGHMEWACPECDSAMTATIWDRAADRELEQAAVEATKRQRRNSGAGRLMVVKNNIDYQSNATYGCHENYSIPRQMRDGRDFFGFLSEALVAFLVTRGILCGTGRIGSANTGPDLSVGFQITQRADFIEQIVSRDTRDGRAIINDRDEPLADKNYYRRLHLIVGDSNLSAWSTLIKVGATGLTLDALEAGELRSVPELNSPIEALHNISRDLECRRRYSLKNGGLATALEIQRQYRDAAARFLTTIPYEDPRHYILEQWTTALNDLATSPTLLSDRADWCIKLQSYNRQIFPSLSTSWEELQTWSWIVLQTSSVSQLPEGADSRTWLEYHLPRSVFSAVQHELEKRRLDWRDYARQRKNYFTVRAIDIRFHDIDRQEGLFHRLYGENAIPGISDAEIERAQREPPRNTRAWLRGQVIRSPNHSQAASMDWDRIKLANGHDISLPNPMSTQQNELQRIFQF
jgi:hypothetical protein